MKELKRTNNEAMTNVELNEKELGNIAGGGLWCNMFDTCKWQCTCGKTFASETNARNHAKSAWNYVTSFWDALKGDIYNPKDKHQIYKYR